MHKLRLHNLPFFVLLFTLLIPLLSSGCSQGPRQAQSVTILTASDLHYLSPELTDGNELFLAMAANGDGKLIHYSDSITDAFLSEVKRAKPDALVLSGDLTYNGEKKSHEALAAKLSALQNDGIPVLVIPGNHDIDSNYACRFEGEYAYRVENISAADFNSIYGDFGYNQADSRDEATFSYLTKVSEKVWLLMLDVNTSSYLSLAQGTRLWLETQLEDAKKAGAEVISVTHQNLLVHNRLFSTGYVIKDTDYLQNLYAAYQVRLNLSGHMHIQHIASESSALYEIASGSLAVSPNQYGILQIDGSRSMNYHTQPVDVSSWAAAEGISDPNLLDFAAYSDQFFRNSASKKIGSSLKELALPQPLSTELRDYAVNINTLYFAGALWKEKDTLFTDPAFQKWKDYSDTVFFSDYLSSMTEGYLKDETSLELPPFPY